MVSGLVTDKQINRQTDRQKSKDRGSPFRAFGVPHFSPSSRSGPTVIVENNTDDKYLITRTTM